MAKIQEGVASSTTYFNLDNLDYARSNYRVEYGDVQNDASGAPVQGLLGVGLKNRFNESWLQSPLHYSNWTDSTDTPFASLSLLLAALNEFVGFDGSDPYPNLVSYFRFNDNVVDQRNLYSVTNTGGTFVTGVSDKAIELGASDDVNFNSNTVIGGRTVFSISGFLKIKAASSDILVNWDGGDDRTILFRNNPMQCFVFTDDDVQHGGTFVHAVITASEWVHVVITYNGTTLNMYVNGVKSVTEYAVTGTINISTPAFGNSGLFKMNRRLTAYGDNEYDGLGIWDIGIDQTMVTEIFNQQSSGEELI